MARKRKLKTPQIHKAKRDSKKPKDNLSENVKPVDVYVDFAKKSEVERNPRKFDVSKEAATKQTA